VLANEDIAEWLSKFDPETRETLQEIQKSETWPIDDDDEVQSYFADIRDLVNKVRSNGSPSNQKMILGKKITSQDIVKLQGQLSYSRAIKLFGDICYLSQDEANKMLSFNNLNIDDDQLTISSSLLARRVYLLIKINLAKRIFSPERYEQVIETIKHQFDLPEG